MEILREKLFQLESVTINHFPDPGDTEKESFIQHFRNELPKQAMWYINEIMFKDERYVFLQTINIRLQRRTVRIAVMNTNYMNE